MRLTALSSVLAVLAFGSCAPAQVGEAAVAPRASAARLANAAQVRKRLGLVPEYDNVRGVESLKIAVLDYGFAGLDGGRRYLPEGAVVVENYDPDFVRRFKLGDPDFRKALDPANAHGRIMAQIVWAVTGSSPKGPQFYLLNANGPTMLRRAVRYAIEQKVDLILFSGAFEGAGNGDGRGPVNRVVADAMAADILWVNAAGNYGRHVYNGPVRVGPDGFLRFRDGADGTALRFCQRLDENPVTVTLTWNDYRDEEDAGTTKDLDLFVEDRAGKRLAASEKVQVAGDKAAGPDETRNPRERIVLNDLPASSDLYRIRVRAKKGEFTADDRVRVLVTAARESYVDPDTGTIDDALMFYDASGKGELFPPADNPLVLTVGDSSPMSAAGPTADYRVKPDAILPDSRAFLTDGDVTSGSSNAAAYLAGVVALMKAAEPGLRQRHLLRLARTESAPRTPATGIGVTLTGPRGGSITAQVSPRAGQSGSGEKLSPPAPRSTSAEDSSAEKRVWRTPSRARLAEVVRSDR